MPQYRTYAPVTLTVDVTAKTPGKAARKAHKRIRKILKRYPEFLDIELEDHHIAVNYHGPDPTTPKEVVMATEKSPAEVLADITTLPELTKFLQEQFCQDGPRQSELISVLDDVVTENKAEEARDINHQGIPGQLRYLASDPDDLRSLVNHLIETFYQE